MTQEGDGAISTRMSLVERDMVQIRQTTTDHRQESKERDEKIEKKVDALAADQKKDNDSMRGTINQLLFAVIALLGGVAATLIVAAASAIRGG